MSYLAADKGFGTKDAVKKSFENSDYVALYQAGMTLVMGLYH